MTHAASWNELEPCKDGVSAALRRAFAVPGEDTLRKFEDLLRQLN